MSTTTAAIARRDALIAERPTAQLVSDLLVLDALPVSSERNMVRIWLIETIEARFPAMDAVMDRIFMGDDFTGSYAEAIALAVEEVAV
jgi:hypothetical protein